MRAEAMHVVLDRDGDPPGPGDPLPPFWHWSQFWTMLPPDQLGRDGHPRRGGLIPDLGLPRRMWAGGRLEFRAPLIVGDAAERRSVVDDVHEKRGRSGRLGFVSVRHEIFRGGALAVREYQDLVYREEYRPEAPAVATMTAPDDEELARRFRVTTTDLFRYSALTFNGHRIHYDQAYARDVEGYGGLVVHGPLLAQRLIEMATERLGPTMAFSFRAVSAVLHTESFAACRRDDGDGLALWVRAEDGRLAMTATAEPID